MPIFGASGLLAPGQHRVGRFKMDGMPRLYGLVSDILETIVPVDGVGVLPVNSGLGKVVLPSKYNLPFQKKTKKNISWNGESWSTYRGWSGPYARLGSASGRRP